MVPIKDVIKTIAEFYNIEEDILYKKTRKREVVKPRQIIMYILREDFNVSYPSIGDKLGGETTQRLSTRVKKIKNEIKIDLILSKEIEQIRSMF